MLSSLLNLLEVGLPGLTDSVPIEGLMDSELRLLLSFPHFDEGIASKRLEELESLGVTTLVKGGPLLFYDLKLLGRGHTGVVVEAHSVYGRVALKLLRMDADRVSMDDEARFLKVANSVNVGPLLYDWSEGCLMMELVEGPYLQDWLDGLPSGESVGGVVRSLFMKARRLDSVGLDHGELAKAFKHVFVSGGIPRIIDFESGSLMRRCQNLTSLVQFIFLNDYVSSRVGRFLPLPDRDEIIEVLGVYKRGMSEESFSDVLRVCGV